MISDAGIFFLAASGDILCVWVDSGLLLDKALRIDKEANNRDSGLCGSSQRVKRGADLPPLW